MNVDAAKHAAGEAAAALVHDGARVGLGTGSTARWFILALGARVHEGLHVMCVPTSEATRRLALEHSIPLSDLGADGLDITVDGADQVDPDLRLIKGGGGAMVREKIVAAAARRFVVVVDVTKLVDVLTARVPVEVIEFGVDRTLAALRDIGSDASLRFDAAGGVVRSDNGNLVADAGFGAMEDAEALGERLDAIPGVVGHGLFLGMTDLVLVGKDDGGVDKIVPRAI